MKYKSLIEFVRAHSEGIAGIRCIDDIKFPIKAGDYYITFSDIGSISFGTIFEFTKNIEKDDFTGISSDNSEVLLIDDETIKLAEYLNAYIDENNLSNNEDDSNKVDYSKVFKTVSDNINDRTTKEKLEEMSDINTIDDYISSLVDDIVNNNADEMDITLKSIVFSKKMLETSINKFSDNDISNMPKIFDDYYGDDFNDVFDKCIDAIIPVLKVKIALENYKQKNKNNH